MLPLGIFNLEKTLPEMGDCAFWDCPHCGCERIVEVDAEYEVKCEECGKYFRIRPVECELYERL